MTQADLLALNLCHGTPMLPYSPEHEPSHKQTAIMTCVKVRDSNMALPVTVLAPFGWTVTEWVWEELRSKWVWEEPGKRVGVGGVKGRVGVEGARGRVGVGGVSGRVGVVSSGGRGHGCGRGLRKKGIGETRSGEF